MAMRILVAILCVLFCQAPSARAALREPNSTTPISVCTNGYAPFVYCYGDAEMTGIPLSPDQVGGYEMDVLANLAAQLGWAPTDYVLHCLPYDDMIGGVTNSSAAIKCDFSMGGIYVTPEYIAEGIQFSWPIHKSGLAVMVTGESKKAGAFAFMSVFSPSLWALLLVLGIVTGIYVWCLDWWFAPWRLRDIDDDAKRKFLAHRLKNSFWFSFGALVSAGRESTPTKVAGRIMGMAWLFVCLITLASFIGNTAANLTLTRLTSGITGVADLPGKVVGTWTEYTSTLEKYSIRAVDFPWDSDEDGAKMIQSLKDRTISALVLDEPYLRFMSSTDKDCDLLVVGQPFEYASYAIAFNPSTPDADVEEVTTAIIRLDKQGVLNSLEAKWISSAGTCSPGSDLSGVTKLTPTSMMGLWLILAGAAGIAGGVCLVDYLRKRGHLKRLHARLSRSPSLSKSILNNAVKLGTIPEPSLFEICVKANGAGTVGLNDGEGHIPGMGIRLGEAGGKLGFLGPGERRDGTQQRHVGSQLQSDGLRLQGHHDEEEELYMAMLEKQLSRVIADTKANLEEMEKLRGALHGVSML